MGKIQEATRRWALLCSALLCSVSCQCADMVLTTKLLIEKSRMWPDGPLAIIKLELRKVISQLGGSSAAGGQPCS